MNLLNYIPQGKDHPITRERLVRLTGKNDRVIRDMIMYLRMSGCKIVSSSKGKGYYIGTDREYELFEKEQVRRAMSIPRVFGDKYIVVQMHPDTQTSSKPIPVKAHFRNYKNIQVEGQVTF